MKSTGIFRRIDSLGRFVLPKELRKTLDINQNDYLQIFLEGDTILLRKSQVYCVLCNGSDDLVDFRDKKICRKCLAALNDLDT
ncbi:MAG: AbrB/MazE/SpoVT family DNA-binding domain-containing protein [Oscillospiraceae bacterium]|nr:AbrB/MazE/SpoVT family DNA-binding domain-containing protein [Oscillospiraceae bacterium]